MLVALIEGALLGVSAAAPIGPVNVEIIRRGLRMGPRPAFFLGLGAVSIDCLYFALAMLAADRARALLEIRWVVASAMAFGGGLLIWLGWRSLRAPVADPSGAPPRSPNLSFAGSYGVGVAMTAANPMTILFWLAMAETFAAAGGGRGESAFRLAGVGAGALAWVCFLVALLARARLYVAPRYLRWVNVGTGLVLIGFGFVFWTRAILR